MENVYPLNPKQLGTYQKRPQPANHFTQSAGKDLITPQTWRKTGKREKCGLGWGTWAGMAKELPLTASEKVERALNSSPICRHSRNCQHVLRFCVNGLTRRSA